MAPFWILFMVLVMISWLVSSRLKSKIREYSTLSLNSNLSGKEVAEKMLKENQIFDVKVVSVEGTLTDHYNPATKTVNLSYDVYHGRNISAAAVAAHECGHAIQHSTLYSFLMFRSALVPFVSFASNWTQWILLAGVLLIAVAPQILLLGIILFAATTLFSFLTLPVEIDASNRALAWLQHTTLTNSDTHPKAAEALRMAAYTYVIAALTSLATLIYYISVYSNRRG